MIFKIEEPNERQKLFFESRTKYTLYGGARGGGKSWAVRVKACLLAFQFAGIRILIVRRTFPELYENHVIPLQEMLHGICPYRDKDKSFNFPNGSRLKLGYCANEGDVLQYQGQEYDIVFMDEATQLTEYQFNMLKAIVRGVNEFPKRIYLTANPGGVGHMWVKRLFIDRAFKGNEKPEEYSFIPAKVYDNKALMDKDPDYLDNLKSLPEDLRKAHLDGDWNVFAGQFFNEFDSELHVCEPFIIPPSWRRYLTLDYGLDMLAAYWIAVNEYGRAYVYREIYQSGLIVSDAADLIKSVNEPVFISYAPPDLWNRRNDTGRSAADIFAEHGVTLARATNNREQGWLDLKEWLHPFIDEQGEKTAGLKIFRNCQNLIRCLPAVQFDEKNPNDMAKEPHELTHSCDSIRYFVAGRPLPASAKVIDSDYSRDIEELVNF